MNKDNKRSNNTKKNKQPNKSKQPNQAKNKTKRTSKKKSKTVKKMLACVILFSMTGGIVYQAVSSFNNKPEVTPGEISNSKAYDQSNQNNNANNNSSDSKNDQTNGTDNNNATNSSVNYEPNNDTSLQVTGAEPDDYVAAKLAKGVAGMVSQSIISQKNWKPNVSNVLLIGSVGDKVKVDFEYDQSEFERNLFSGAGKTEILPVLEAKAVNPVKGGSAEALKNGYNIQKINDNSYSAEMRINKALVPNVDDQDLKSLHTLSKQVIADYETEGTLDEHTYTDVEKLIITKTNDGWSIRFERSDWFMPR